MRSSIEIVQVSDGTWYLQFLSINELGEVNVDTLMPFTRYIYAKHAAQLLQLHVDNVRSIYGKFDQAV
jgi:hypothetical protein